MFIEIDNFPKFKTLKVLFHVLEKFDSIKLVENRFIYLIFV